MPYVVLHHTLCSGWIPDEHDAEGNIITYATALEAVQSRDTFLREIQDDIDAGERAEDAGYSLDDYEIEACGEDGQSPSPAGPAAEIGWLVALGLIGDRVVAPHVRAHAPDEAAVVEAACIAALAGNKTEFMEYAPTIHSVAAATMDGAPREAAIRLAVSFLSVCHAAGNFLSANDETEAEELSRATYQVATAAFLAYLTAAILMDGTPEEAEKTVNVVSGQLVSLVDDYAPRQPSLPRTPAVRRFAPGPEPA